MSGFIEWLETLNENDTKARAVLRRSLAFTPGSFIPAYPYVEPFVKDEESFWRREVCYLVAGVWAAYWRADRTGGPISIGKACAAYYLSRNKTKSVERRLISLLDADSDQLAHRLRQMIALLKEYSIDFDDLFKGLLDWRNDQKRTQKGWARDFYQNI